MQVFRPKGYRGFDVVIGSLELGEIIKKGDKKSMILTSWACSNQPGEKRTCPGEEDMHSSCGL
jgi:hypothetical protein